MQCSALGRLQTHGKTGSAMTKKSIQAALEATFLHGSPFSADLLNNVLMNFIDELEESLHNDADDALICVVEDDHDVAMLLIEWDGAVPVSYTHLRAHETDSYLVCRLLLE